MNGVLRWAKRLVPVVLWASQGAWAQEESSSLPPPVVDPPSLVERDVPPAQNRSGTLSVAPKSLMEQRLHESAYPREAEFRCLFATSCDFGLTRGFTIGSDLGSVIGTPFFRPIAYPGRWLVVDAYAGFQFLRAVDERVFFNMSLGYRFIEHAGSDGRSADARGMTFKVAYGQQILDFYSQGVLLDGFYANNKIDNVGDQFQFIGTDDKEFIDRFYKFSQGYPRFRFSLPADFEVINWKNTHVDLPNHLRGYVRVEPFFIQNEFEEVFPDINKYNFTEYNYGLRVAYLMSYVSPKERYGRLGFFGGIGVDVQASSSEVSYDNQADDFRVELPTRSIFAPYWQVGASFQF